MIPAPFASLATVFSRILTVIRIYFSWIIKYHSIKRILLSE